MGVSPSVQFKTICFGGWPLDEGTFVLSLAEYSSLFHLSWTCQPRSGYYKSLHNMHWSVRNLLAPNMSRDNDSRTIFTFRIASDEMKRVATQLSGMTIQSKTVGEAIDSIQSNIDKKRKELRTVNRRIEARKKVLVRLGKRHARECE